MTKKSSKKGARSKALAAATIIASMSAYSVNSAACPKPSLPSQPWKASSAVDNQVKQFKKEV